MSDKTKKILIFSSITLVLFVIILVLWLYWPAITGTIRNEKYYTQEEVDSAVSEAYDQGVGDKNSYIEQIDYYKNQLELSSLQLSEVTQQLTETTQQLSEALQNNSSSAEKIEELNSTIESLNRQIQIYLEQIKELQLKLDAYTEYEGVAGYATFYVDGSIYDVDVVNLNDGIVEFPNITVEGCNFEGWSIDGINDIETENYTIQSDTNFYALLTCDVTFSINGTTTHKTVPKNTILSAIVPEVEEFEGYVLDGFYEGDLKVDGDATITKHTTFVAKFRKYIEDEFDLNTVDDREDFIHNNFAMYSLMIYRDIPFESNIQSHCEFKITYNNGFEYEYDETNALHIIEINNVRYYSSANFTLGKLDDGTPYFGILISFMTAPEVEESIITEQDIELIQNSLFPLNVIVYDTVLYTEVT